jgi:hypothetical protein
VTYRAPLECNWNRRTCAWEVQVPQIPGMYTVTAQATDLAGNQERPGPQIKIFVL